MRRAGATERRRGAGAVLDRIGATSPNALRWALALLLAATLAGSSAVVWWARGGLPLRSGELRVPGLVAPVDVRWDAYGVPHLKGADGLDLALALGFLHANDRMVQLELGRRAVAGRLSEVFGERPLDADIQARRLRLRDAAEVVLGRTGPESRRWLEAYSAGVNAWLTMRGSDLPPELRLLGVRPEPWTPVDSLGFVFQMARDLSFWQGRPEELRFQWLRALGLERTLDLLGAPQAQVAADVLAAAVIPAPSTPKAGPAEPVATQAPGSNGWVAGATRSVDGAPLAANDLHLPLRLPALWYQAHLRAPDYEAAGITLPGLPGVVVGQNARLAWAFTNAMMDDHDLFLEQLDASGTRVRRGADWVALDGEDTQIVVRGRAPVRLTLNKSEHGPVLPADPVRGLPARSLAWTAYLATDPLAAFLHLARAERVDDIPRGIDGFAAPAQNLMAVDRDGGLLHIVLGRMPQRRQGDGRLPAPGWDPAYGWDGLQPVNANPRLAAVDEIIVTANDALPASASTTRPGAPMTGDFAVPARARRIRELLASRTRWRAEDFAALQNDTVSLYARTLVARSTGRHAGSAGEAYRHLAAWDGDMGLTGVAALFELYEHHLQHGIFADELDVTQASAVVTRHWLLRVLQGEMNPAWFDNIRTPATEGRPEIVEQALAQAWDTGVARWGTDVEHWPRGAWHGLMLRHPLGSLPLIGRLLDRGPFPVAGSSTTVAAFPGTLPDSGAVVDKGPSIRWVAVAGDGDRSLAVLPGGQSGHPFDRHYDDQLALYLRGGMRPLAWSEPAIARATVSTLRLLPASPRP